MLGVQGSRPDWWGTPDGGDERPMPPRNIELQLSSLDCESSPEQRAYGVLWKAEEPRREHLASMADPLSIAGLALSVAQVADILHDYLSSVRSAKEDIRRLSLELFALKGALDYFEVSSRKGAHFSPSADVAGMVDMAGETLKAIQKHLERPASGMGRALQSLAWPFKKAEVDRYVAVLERTKTWFIMVLMQDATDSTSAVYADAQRLLAVIHEDILERKVHRMAAETETTLGWLAPVNNDDEHLKASRGRVPGTGMWFRDEQFDLWSGENPPPRPLLWVLGKCCPPQLLPKGYGSIANSAHLSWICSSVIDHLRSQCAVRPDRRGCAFHYCSLDNAASQQDVNVLGALLAQLTRAKPELVELLRPLMKPRNALVPRNSLTLSELEDLLIYGIGLFDIFYAVIDALNETPHHNEILASVMRLCASCKNLRVLVTSTKSPLEQSQLILLRKMTVDAVDHDIETYVQHRLATQSCFELLSPSIQDNIKSVMAAGANGTWAQLCMDRLSTLRTGRDVRSALADMPSTLNETYAAMLERVPASDAHIAREALQWLCFSALPPTLSQLGEVVVMNESDRFLDDDCRLHNPASILDICHGLTQVDDGHVTLAHDSIRLFLTSDWIQSSRVSRYYLDPASSHRAIARKCLVYLCLDEFAAGHVDDLDQLEKRRADWPLATYAAIYWSHHSNLFDLDASDEDLILSMFSSKSQKNGGSFESWVQFLLDSVQAEPIRETEPLYYAASFNMVAVLKLLLQPERGVDVDKPGGRSRVSPLSIACFRGCNEAALMLLQAGANPDGFDRTTGSTIKWMARDRKMGAVLELIDKVSAERRASTRPPHG